MPQKTPAEIKAEASAKIILDKATADAKAVADQATVDAKAVVDKATADVIAEAKAKKNPASEKPKKEPKYVNPKVKVGNDNYEVVVKSFRYLGETYTAQELVENAEILKTLVETGYVGLKKV